MNCQQQPTRVHLLRCALVTALVLNTSIYFLTMDGNITRCIEGQPHFVPAYVHNRQLDVRPNHNSFTAFSTQDQHGVLLLSGVEPVQIFWFRSGIGVHNFRPTGRSSFEQSTMGSMEQPRITVNVLWRRHTFPLVQVDRRSDAR